MALDASYRRIARVRLASRRNLSRGHALCRSANGFPSPGSNLGWPYPAGVLTSLTCPKDILEPFAHLPEKLSASGSSKSSRCSGRRGVHTCCYKHGPKSLTTISRTSFAIVPAVSRSCRLTPDFLMLSENASKHEAADDTALTIRDMLLLSHSSEHMPAIPKERSRSEAEIL